MSENLRIGIAGLGNVGLALAKLIDRHTKRLRRATGKRLEIAAVAVRDPKKPRKGLDLAKLRVLTDPVALAKDPGIDLFVELIGGEGDPAKAAVEAALKAGKSVVTANKALIAHHGVALARLAEEKGVALNFEAAVAGGIPVIKTLREALVGNKVTRIYGILNGTCNYILTKMQDEGRAFDDVLKEAQAKGYAEADPTFDIGGFDTAHKLTILTSLAFGTEVALKETHVEGIGSITPADIEAADDLGYRIKLLGVALETDSGIEARVHPSMVPKQSAIAEISGVTNAVAIEGDYVGKLLLAGPGAGGEATASAVMSDIADIARGAFVAPFLRPAKELKPFKRAKLGQHQGAYYIRLQVFDQPGAMAVITRRMGEEDVSLESIVQRRPRKSLPGIAARDHKPGEPVPVILITHETTESAIRKALKGIQNDGKVASPPQMIRIESL